MLFRFPKDDKTYHWTSHIKNKMLYYRVSEQKIRAILKNPDRREEGVAPDTSAVMKRNDTPKRKEEIWVMYAKKSNVKSQKSKVILVSAWRYPGESKKGKTIPIPDDILHDLGWT